MASFDPELVSLPSGTLSPVPLEDLLGQDGQHEVKEFSSSQTLATAQAQEKMEAMGLGRSYEDPQFRQRNVYVGFVNRLLQLGMLDLSIEPPVERTGMFLVKKKGGRQRLIFDCRRSNCHFTDPTPIKLATGDSIGRLETGRTPLYYFASADLANAFYTMSMPQNLRQFFGLRSLTAAEAGVDEINGVKVGPGQLVHPRIAVVPMGWSWAMYWCQHINEHLCEEAGLTSEERLRDGEPVRAGSFWHIQYVDNLHLFGTNKAEVESRFWKAVDRLRRAGLTVHEIEINEGSAEVLGWRVEEGGVLRPTLKRLWRIRTAVRELLRRGRASGQQLERLLGHMTFVSLCRREALSVLGECYTFCKRHYKAVVPLWKSVRKELAIWDGISVLIYSNMRSCWSNTVYAVDASEWGLGVTTSEFRNSEVQTLGTFLERWRFKDEAARNPRAFARASDDAVFGGVGIADQAMDKHTFETVGFWAVDRSWQVVGWSKWLQHESMPVYEARASLFAVKHALRRVSNFGKRHLVLTDSLTASVALDKGRAHGHRLRRVVQQVSALCLCSGCIVRSRWIPSEWNPADKPSRGGYIASVPERCFGDDPPPAGNPSDLGSGHQEEKWRSEEEAQGGFTNGRVSCCSADMGHRTQCRLGSSKTAAEVEEEKAVSGEQSKFQPSRSFGGASHKEEVRGHVGAIPGVVRRSNAGHHEQESAGCAVDRIPRVFVSGGGRPKQSKLCHSSSVVQGAGHKRVACLAEDTAKHERLEATAPSQGTHAGSVRSSVFVGNGSCASTTVSDCVDSALDVPLVPPTLGALPDPSAGHCGTCQGRQKTIQTLCHLAASKRRGGSVEGASVRRNDQSRLEASEFSGASLGEAFEVEQPEEVRVGIQLGAKRVGDIRGEPLGATRLKTTRCPPPLPAATRGGLTRCSHGSTGDDKHPVPGQMADSEVPQELHKRGTASTTLQKPRSKRAKARHSGRSADQQKFPIAALLYRFVPHVSFFLEIFSGSGHLASAVHTTMGCACLLWDISLGAAYDLTKRCNQRRILHWLEQGYICGGHLGTPCNSFSRARDRPGGPPPLRSDQRPLGLPQLKESDALKVRLCNVLMYFSCHVLQLALQLHVPFTMENPSRSRLWLCPAVLRIMRRRFVQTVDVTYCVFGTAWKKPTKILGVHLDLSILEMHYCRGSKRGLCLFTGRPHLALMGQTNGVWRTKLAEPYPKALCRLLAKCFDNVELALTAQDFGRHLL